GGHAQGVRRGQRGRDRGGRGHRGRGRDPLDPDLAAIPGRPPVPFPDPQQGRREHTVPGPGGGPDEVGVRSRSPSPLGGEGWGEGTFSPLPWDFLPSPPRGEGWGEGEIFL